MKKLFALGILSVFFMILGYCWVVWTQFLNHSAGESDQEILHEITPGKPFYQVASELEKKGIIKNAQLFSFYGRLIGSAKKIRMGEYALRQNMLPKEVLDVIISGKSISRPFTVAEGLNIFDISKNYEKAGFGKAEDFLSVVIDPQTVKKLIGDGPETLEGYLYPETYQLTKYTTALELVTKMVKNFESNYALVIQDLGQKNEFLNLKKHQIVTLASIIEKETGVPEERPLISSVFHNRLQKGMLLQTDPTIIYGIMEQTKQPVLNITREDILRPSRYNTYIIKGLPPGPISNPGKEALLAAMKPEKSDYLFFVSHNDGTHAFSENLENHNKAVKKFQVNTKAREGKSWRNLKKARSSSKKF